MLFKFLLDDVARKSPRPPGQPAANGGAYTELDDYGGSTTRGSMVSSARNRGTGAHARDIELSRTKSAPRSKLGVKYPFSPPRRDPHDSGAESPPPGLGVVHERSESPVVSLKDNRLTM
jgi:hypothetical protein